MTNKRFNEAEKAVASILGLEPDQILVEVDEVDSRYLNVNWQTSMLCVGPQLEAVKQAVVENVPPQYRTMKVSIT